MDLRPEEYLEDEDLKSIAEQIRDYKFKAGLDDYEIFLEGPVWDDLRTNIIERIDDAQNKLESMGNSHMMDVMYKSRLHELRQLLEYPQTVIKLLRQLEEIDDEPT